MKLFEHWLHYSFDWKSLGLALLIVVISIVLVNGIVRGIFHQIEKRIPDRFAGWTDVLMALHMRFTAQYLCSASGMVCTN